MNKPKGDTNLALVLSLVAYCGVVTAVYVASQQPVFHEVMFGVLCAALTALDVREARRRPRAVGPFVAAGVGM